MLHPCCVDNQLHIAAKSNIAQSSMAGAVTHPYLHHNLQFRTGPLGACYVYASKQPFWFLCMCALLLTLLQTAADYVTTSDWRMPPNMMCNTGCISRAAAADTLIVSSCLCLCIHVWPQVSLSTYLAMDVWHRGVCECMSGN